MKIKRSIKKKEMDLLYNGFGIPNIQHKELEGYICEWCKMHYPLGGWDYYQLIVCYGKTTLHTICSDCYDKLKEGYIETYIQRKNNKS